MTTTTELTIQDLARLLHAAAGDTGSTIDDDALDSEFAELGYDSLAMLETGSLIERERGIELDDGTVFEAKSPRALLAAVNARLVSSTTI